MSILLPFVYMSVSFVEIIILVVKIVLNVGSLPLHIYRNFYNITRENIALVYVPCSVFHFEPSASVAFSGLEQSLIVKITTLGHQYN
jgi:hypothetical protein